LGNQDVVSTLRWKCAVQPDRRARPSDWYGSIAYLALADPSAFQNHTIQWTFTVFDPEGVKPASYSSKSEITALSTRATVSSGDNVLIAGFIVDGKAAANRCASRSARRPEPEAVRPPTHRDQPAPRSLPVLDGRNLAARRLEAGSQLAARAELQPQPE